VAASTSSSAEHDDYYFIPARPPERHRRCLRRGDRVATYTFKNASRRTPRYLTFTLEARRDVALVKATARLEMYEEGAEPTRPSTWRHRHTVTRAGGRRLASATDALRLGNTSRTAASARIEECVICHNPRATTPPAPDGRLEEPAESISMAG